MLQSHAQQQLQHEQQHEQHPQQAVSHAVEQQVPHGVQLEGVQPQGIHVSHVVAQHGVGVQELHIVEQQKLLEQHGAQKAQHPAMQFKPPELHGTQKLGVHPVGIHGRHVGAHTGVPQ
jgi:hypothetical protein